MLRLIAFALLILVVIVGASANRYGQTIPQPSTYLPYAAVPSPTATPTATAAATVAPVPTPMSTLIPTATPARFVCSHDFYNCGDFFVWQDAQDVFTHCLDVVGFDVHRLDQNNDGIACNALRP